VSGGRAPALLLLALALLAVPRPAPAGDGCTQQHRRVRLPDGFAAARLSFVAVAADGRNHVGGAFTAPGLREIRLVAEWTEVEGTHLQRLEVFSPDGSLYQRIAAGFTGSGRTVAVATRLPVDGTPIVDAGLYGDWCVELFLDDEEAPIARRGFALSPATP
jgi:hypothetical protein